MLLTVDIGNTNITFGIFREEKIIRRFDISTRGYNSKRLKAQLGKNRLESCIFCSVVPRLNKILERDLKKLSCGRIYIVGRDIKVPIKNLYCKPKQVGQDRLVNAYAVSSLYGSPAIVVDFGTAITFDIISKNKEYLGGMILPGLQISLDALSEKTALLPKIKLARPKEFIGKDTKNSLLSGVIYGFAALSDGLIERIKAVTGKKAKVIGTGGNIALMAKFCRRINKIDRDLTLKGLRLIYKNEGKVF